MADTPKSVLMQKMRWKRRLAVLPENRICEHCNRTILNSRSWVALDVFLGCRRCWHKAGKPKGARLIDQFKGEFTDCCECGTKLVKGDDFEIFMCKKCVKKHLT